MSANPNRILRIKEVSKLIGLSKSMIYLIQNTNSPYFNPLFPKSIPLSKRARGWRVRDIHDFLDAQEKLNFRR